MSETIFQDITCRSCGYNLKGIDARGRCPECGEFISSRAFGDAHRRSFQGNLGEAPKGFLLLLSAAMLATGVGQLAMLLLWGWTVVYGLSDIELNIAAIVAGVLYLAGIAGMVVPAPKQTSSARPRTPKFFIVVAISGAACWILHPVLVIWTQAAASALSSYVVGFLFVAGAFSAAAVGVILSDIAEWASDTVIANWLRNFAWGQAAGLTVCLLVKLFEAAGLPFVGLLYWVMSLGALAWLVCVLMAGISAIQMLRMVFWAVRNTKERVERDRRIARRAREYEERRQVAMDLANASMPPEQPVMEELDPLTPRPGMKTHQISRPTGEASPYGLEDDKTEHSA